MEYIDFVIDYANNLASPKAHPDKFVAPLWDNTFGTKKSATDFLQEFKDLLQKNYRNSEEQ